MSMFGPARGQISTSSSTDWRAGCAAMTTGRVFGARLAGVAFVCSAIPVSFFALMCVLFAAEVPNAFDQEGDPCCGTPDTWGEVAQLAGAAFVLSVIAASLLACAGALLVAVPRGRRPAVRTVVALPAVVVSLLATLLPIAWLVQTPHTRASCHGFSVSAGRWRSATVDSRLRTAEALDRCRTLERSGAHRVVRLLGSPDREGPTELQPGTDRILVYEHVGARPAGAGGTQSLSVYLLHGRVAFARFSTG